jgi:ssRNA-specific RNase YbeY (16S rRNA maturation enzyme)
LYFLFYNLIMIEVTSLETGLKKLEKPIAGVIRALFKIKEIKKSHVAVYIMGDGFAKNQDEASLSQSDKIKNNVAQKIIAGFNVISLPAVVNFPRPDLGVSSLGEIYLNPDYIKRRGEDLNYMIIHGFLHLLGYDHKRTNDRIKMEKEEKRLYDLLVIKS